MTSAVDAIAKNRTLWETVKAVGNTYMNFTYGCGQDSEFVNSVFKKKMSVKEAWKESKLGESYWERLKGAFSRSNMKSEWEGLSKSGNGAFKKGLMFLGHRMPFIMNAFFLVKDEIPNAYRAFTDKEHGGGIGTGTKEVVKSGAKMTAMAAGAAIGSLIIPVFGGLVGGLLGGVAANMLANYALGDSFTDKVKEAEEKSKQGQQPAEMLQAQQSQQPQLQQVQQQTGQLGNIPGLTNPYPLNPYGFSGASRNSIFEMDWKDKDLMAMGVGLA